MDRGASRGGMCMNRRSFLKTLSVVAAGFSILPPATTYQRIWKAEKQIQFDPKLYSGDWNFFTLIDEPGCYTYKINKALNEWHPLSLNEP